MRVGLVSTAGVEAHAQPTSSARRRGAARARWLRMITDNSCSRSLCKVAESSPVRAAALQAICSRSWLAARSHAPVDSATKGTNCTPCWLQRWAVFCFGSGISSGCCQCCCRALCQLGGRWPNQAQQGSRGGWVKRCQQDGGSGCPHPPVVVEGEGLAVLSLAAGLPGPPTCKGHPGPLYAAMSSHHQQRRCRRAEIACPGYHYTAGTKNLLWPQG